jgi:DNA-binding NtrC family response regulator
MKKILLIDNDIFFGKMCANSFVNNKIDVVFARNIDGGIEKYGIEKDIKLIIIDSSLINDRISKFIEEKEKGNIEIFILNSGIDFSKEEADKMGIKNFLEKSLVTTNKLTELIKEQLNL